MTWLRLLAIGIAALALASCRSMPAPHATTCCEPPPCPAECRPAECCEEPPPCPPLAIIPPPPVPVARICKVCDGGDGGMKAKPSGKAGIENLTAGDTVARFRDSADAEGDDCIVASNCACVCAPRFASVRLVTRPQEEEAPTAAVAVALDDSPELAARSARSRAGTQRIPPVLARAAVPELAVVDARPPHDLERNTLPGQTPYVCVPAEDSLDVQPEVRQLARRPQAAVAFDVPIAWTCLAQAQVMIQEQAADAVSIAEGTAVLRLKQPGRRELTLCKTAGGKTVRAGEELDFTIALYNSGDVALDGIVLADALPKRLTFVPDSADSTLSAAFATETADDGAVVLRWVFKEPLPAGASGFVRFRTIVR